MRKTENKIDCLLISLFWTIDLAIGDYHPLGWIHVFRPHQKKKKLRGKLPIVHILIVNIKYIAIFLLLKKIENTCYYIPQCFEIPTNLGIPFSSFVTTLFEITGIFGALLSSFLTGSLRQK